ncbi:protein unc-13 homolog D-like [Glandiceps talaboti]
MATHFPESKPTASDDAEISELRLDFYTALLHDLVHPLGNQDNDAEVGVAEITNHVREVFHVDLPTHEQCLGEAMVNKSENVVLKLTVMEAKDIKAMDANGLSDPYCMLSLVYPSKLSSGTPPKQSHHLRRSFRHKMRKYGSFDICEPVKTKIKWETLKPKWDEEFVLDVSNIDIEELHLYMWDYDEESSVIDGIRQFDREHRLAGLRNIFRQLRQTVEHGKPMDDFLGKVYIPVRDIPSIGCDRWFKLHKQTLSSAPVTGDVRLRLQLSLKDTSLSCEGYDALATQIYKFNADKNNNLGEDDVDSFLSNESSITLYQFAIHHGISDINRCMINMYVVLALYTESECRKSVLVEAISKVNDEITKKSFDRNENPLRSSVSTYVLSLLPQLSAAFIDTMLDKLFDEPNLFPPDIKHLQILDKEYSLNITSSLLNLLGLVDEGRDMKEKLAKELHDNIESDTDKWLTERLECGPPVTKGVLRPAEMTELLENCKETVEALVTFCSVKAEYQEFFQRFDVAYYAVIGQTIDRILSRTIQELLLKLHKYQLRYQDYDVNILSSSKQSLTVYFALKKLIQVMQQSAVESDKLTLHEYTLWFQNALIFWLQTFKSECENRVRKALEMDPNATLVDSSVNFSISSVDVHCCFAQITKEWNDIDYDILECSLIGVTKLTEVICDGAKLYTESIQGSIERDGFHEDDTDTPFAIQNKLCISLNNIERVRQHLHKLPELLKWECIIDKMVAQTHDTKTRDQLYKSLQRHIKLANSDILKRNNSLVRKVAVKMSVEIKTNMSSLLEETGDLSIDPLLMYLDRNLELLYKQLMEPLYDNVVKELWNSLLNSLSERMELGAKPEYYALLDEHLSILEKYFGEENLGLSDQQVKQYQYHNVRNQLSVNRLSSLDLICEYYQNMTNICCKPVVSYGDIAIKIGYMQYHDETITLFVKIVKGVNLRINKGGSCSPYVVLHLCPERVFPGSKVFKTKVESRTNNPYINEVIKFHDLPKHVLTSKGAVLSLTVMNQHLLLADDYIGEVFIHLSCATEIPMIRSVEVCPCIMLPLKGPVEDQDCQEAYHDYFKILKYRSKWDKTAKLFILKRQMHTKVKQHEVK